jgi:hypothetical protein
MANLEERITQWRRELAESLGGSAEVLEELEGHLRDEVGRLVQAGQPAEHAFDAAVTRLGGPQALAAEFARLAPPVSWLPVRLAFVVFIAAAGCLGGLLIAGLRGNLDVLLAAHVGAVTLGYTTTLLVGTLAACYLVARPFGAPSPQQIRSLTRAVLVLNVAALGLTVIGVVLGGCWAQANLGRFWGWDPKETGAALVLMWNTVMVVILGRRLLGEHATLMLGLTGNAIVVLAWFGPAVLGVGLHAYGLPPLALPLGVFLLVHLALACLGFAPPGGLRGRKIRGAG